MASLVYTTMTSKTDPKKLKALLSASQNEEDGDEEVGGGDAGDEAGDEELDEETEAGDEETGDEEEATVESLTTDLAPALATINEIVDEFRTGSEAQPHAGIELLEEELDGALVHAFCAWTVEAGKKDFRKLAEGLGVEDEDGFVGLCRAIRKKEEEGGEEAEGGGEEEETEEETGEEGEGGEEGGGEMEEESGGE